MSYHVISCLVSSCHMFAPNPAAPYSSPKQTLLQAQRVVMPINGLMLGIHLMWLDVLHPTVPWVLLVLIKASQGSGFHQGTGTSSLSTCAICLGCHPHNMSGCSSTTLWDGSPAHCKQVDGARIVNPSGLSLCVKWQLQIQCASLFHGDGHECSGCGVKDHGAQRYPCTQKV